MPCQIKTVAKLDLRSSARTELIEITNQINEALMRHDIHDGLVTIFVPHTTAGVILNENVDPAVRKDVLRKLETLVPREEPFYTHGEGNSDSHVKTALVGNSVTLMAERGKLILGQWQGVFLAEFDGPRERSVIVKVVNMGQQRE